MKHLSAIITALIITAVIGRGMVVVGVNAFTNTNTVPLRNSPSSSLANNTSNSSAQSPTVDQGQVQQLQQEVGALQSQLQQDSQVIQQYQNLLVVL